ncbi:MAG: rRNA maturation RNase YbeY [Flavobacteriaceae bacterium]
MIYYNYETEFKLNDEKGISQWITNTIQEENCTLEEVSYIFCDDAYLLEKNIKYLNHNTLTDIISFDYSVGKTISGDIFISIERVTENAKTYNVSFKDELQRVIIHGILHYCGYKDKNESDKKEMRKKENYYLNILLES